MGFGDWLYNVLFGPEPDPLAPYYDGSGDDENAAPVITNPITAVETGVAAAAGQIKAGIGAAVDALPSQTALWFYIIALILILVLAAYVAREVAG